MAITKIPAAGFTGNNFRNIIINGDMSIAQRGTSVTGITGSSYNTLDRMRVAAGTAGTWTQSQSTDVPTGQGFANSLKMDCTTANASLSAGSNLQIQQRIEGQNLQYIKKGTSSAESTTASFWVKSNKTGTYICGLRDLDNNRAISKSYTISSANTWEKKTIIFAGDTTGTLNNDNGESFRIDFHLVAGSNFTSGTLQTSWGTRVDANRAVGQVNLADSTSNYINFTGVQLEAGTTASDFEFLPYDVNLDRCYRYYQLFASGNGKAFAVKASARTSSFIDFTYPCAKPLRAAPSLDAVSITNGYYTYGGNNGYQNFNVPTINSNYFIGSTLVTGSFNGGTYTVGDSRITSTDNSSCYLALDSEL